MEGNLIKVGQRFGSQVTADDPDDVAREVASAVPVQQVSQTVVIAGNQNNRRLRSLRNWPTRRLSDKMMLQQCS
jgi:hypothetical protein